MPTKSKAASDLARRRWAKTTKAERLAQGKKLALARAAKRLAEKQEASA